MVRAAATFKSLLLAAVAALAPIHAVLGSMLLLVFADAFLGMWAARVRGERITSAGMRRTAVKAGVYVGACLIVFGLEALLFAPLVPLLHDLPVLGSVLQALAPFPGAKVVAGWLVITEVVSLAENFDVVAKKPVFGPLAAKVAPAKVLAAVIAKLSSANDKGGKGEGKGASDGE